MLMIEPKEAYKNNGFDLLEGLYDREVLMDFKNAVLQNHQSELDTKSGVKVWSAKDLPGIFREILFQGELISQIKNCLACNRIEFLSCKIVYKSKDVVTNTPWHQDRPYWGGSEKLSVWIAMDDVNCENGCLRIVPNSHLKELVHSKGEANNFSNRLDYLYSDEEILDVPMKVGDALLFSDLLVHSSYKNISGKDRFSIIPTFRRKDSQDKSKLNEGLWSAPLEL